MITTITILPADQEAETPGSPWRNAVALVLKRELGGPWRVSMGTAVRVGRYSGCFRLGDAAAALARDGAPAVPEEGMPVTLYGRAGKYRRSAGRLSAACKMRLGCTCLAAILILALDGLGWAAGTILGAAGAFCAALGALGGAGGIRGRLRKQQPLASTAPLRMGEDNDSSGYPASAQAPSDGPAA